MAKQYVPRDNSSPFTGQARTADIYADWEQSGGDLGQGPVGHAKGNRLPFEPAHQKPGVVPFKTKGR